MRLRLNEFADKLRLIYKCELIFKGIRLVGIEINRKDRDKGGTKPYKWT